MARTKHMPSVQKKPAPSSDVGPSVGRRKKSAPRKNQTHVKVGTRVMEEMRRLQGYSQQATKLCISKMGFARQVYFI